MLDKNFITQLTSSQKEKHNFGYKIVYVFVLPAYMVLTQIRCAQKCNPWSGGDG